MFYKGEEAFSMWLFVKWYASVTPDNRVTEATFFVQFFDIGRDIIVAFRSKKETVLWTNNTACDSKIVAKLRMCIRCMKVEVPGSAFRIKPLGDSERFNQCWLSGTIFSDKKCYLPMKIYSIFCKVFDYWKRIKILYFAVYKWFRIISPFLSIIPAFPSFQTLRLPFES